MAETPSTTCNKEPVPDNHPALVLDPNLYQSYLDEMDITPEERDAFLQTLWTIMVGFVDLGFGIHPLQQCQKHKDNTETIHMEAQEATISLEAEFARVLDSLPIKENKTSKDPVARNSGNGKKEES